MKHLLALATAAMVASFLATANAQAFNQNFHFAVGLLNSKYNSQSVFKAKNISISAVVGDGNQLANVQIAPAYKGNLGVQLVAGNGNKSGVYQNGNKNVAVHVLNGDGIWAASSQTGDGSTVKIVSNSY